MGKSVRITLPSICSVVALGLTPSDAVSAEKAKSSLGNHPSPLDQCLDAGDARMGIMPAIFDCYSAELSRKDRILNDSYRSVRKELAPTKQQQLQVLERRWIGTRDRTCEAEAKKEGGLEFQDGKLIWYGCLIGETDRRIDWLKNYGH